MRLTTTIILGLLAGAAQADWSLPITGVAATPPEGEVRRLSQQALPAEAQAAWDESFEGQFYFGAFALAKSGGWGFAVGVNSLEAAHDIALQECLAQNDQCRIVAELLPVGWAEPAPGQATMSPQTAEVYATITGQGGFRAMAVSADGAYSLVWDEPSQDSADAAALEQCESYRTSHLPGLADYPCHLLPSP